MKKDEVPQDPGGLGSYREIAYARDENGKYVLVPSAGWDVKKVANELAWDHIRKKADDVLEQVRAGRLSPLAYYMALQHLEPAILAKYVGLAKWRVKRHMKAEVFNNLKPSVLEKYADFFDLSLEEFRSGIQEKD